MSESSRQRDDIGADESSLDKLVAAVVSYDDAPDECTIYPADLDDDALVTRWITAEEGSFVSATDAR